MKILIWRTALHGCRALVVAGLMISGTSAYAQLVPGTGMKLEQVGDDFEDESWDYTPNLPKSSQEQDGRSRGPLGFATNGRWTESGLRGQPDLLKRVPTPPGGLTGSKGSLLIQSQHTGIPDHPIYTGQQDDLLANVSNVVGMIPASQNPSVVMRVYVPEFDKWSNRQGPSFGFRLGLRAYETKKPKDSGRFARAKTTLEPYWPGIFICRNTAKDAPAPAYLLIRSQGNGGDVRSLNIKEPGWWTLGISVTGDGSVHYYGHPGVSNLSSADHLGSYRPYGLNCDRFNSFFLNVTSPDDGHSWSTPWVIDDPSVYVGNGGERMVRRAAPVTNASQNKEKETSQD